MTTPANYYISVAELKAALRIKDDEKDVLLDRAIASASWQINDFCNDQFWTDTDTGPTPRLFQIDHARRLLVPSFATTAGLVVEVDHDDDGTFETTWTVGVDYQAAPVSPVPGRPYTEIQTLGSAFFPGSCRNGRYAYGRGTRSYDSGNEWHSHSLRPRVRVTALWGWPAVPPPVTQACQIIAIADYKTKDLTGGSAGQAGLSSGAKGFNPIGLDPAACRLLHSLHEPVVA